MKIFEPITLSIATALGILGQKVIKDAYNLFSAPCKTGFAQKGIFGLLAAIFAEIPADSTWPSAN